MTEPGHLSGDGRGVGSPRKLSELKRGPYAQFTDVERQDMEGNLPNRDHLSGRAGVLQRLFE
jgi:hypothetical protein